MSLFFVGQFGRDVKQLPLPKEFDLLSVFKCSNRDCDFWFNRFGGAPFFRLFDTTAVSEVQFPDTDWSGKGVYPPPGIEFDKFGPANLSIACEVGFPFAISAGQKKIDYPGWEECPSWRRMNDAVFYEYMELRPIEGIKLLGHPKWVQSPEYPRCRCRRKMKQLIQLDYPHVLLGDAGRMHIFFCEKWCSGNNSLAALWQCG